MALLSISLFTPAFAADPGAYVLVDVGVLTYTEAPGFSNPGKVGIGGGYNFSPNFGAELSYHSIGSSTYSGTILGSPVSSSVRASSIVAAVVGNLPVNNSFSVFAKLGASSNNSSQDVTVSGTTTTKSDSKTDIYYAAGAKFNVTKSVDLYLEYESFGAYQSSSNPSKGSATTLGLTYGF